MEDPARPRKLLLAFVTLAVIAGVTYFLSSKQEAEGNVATPAAAIPAPSEAPVAEAPKPAEPPDNTPPAREKAVLLKALPTDIAYGKPDAPVTIIEYASLSCSHCARFQTDMLPKLQEKYIDSGKVRLLHRFFPLNEPALRASQIVACAEKEKQHAFLNVLFKTQTQWAFDPSYKESLARVASVGGMSRETFDACLADKKGEEAVLLSRKEGQQVMGVESTPSFLIGETKLDGEQSLEQLSAVIDPLLK